MMNTDDDAFMLGDFYKKMTGSDTTDTREPLPRHRQDPPQEEDEREREAFDLEYHDNSDFDAYVAVMNEIEHLVPDSQEAKRKRAVVWDRLAYLVESGITTGSRLLDRMIAQGIETRLRSPNTPIFQEQSQHRLNILNAKIPAKPVQSFVRTL